MCEIKVLILQVEKSSVYMGAQIITASVITLALLLVAVIAMAFKPLFVRGGKFPNIHIGGNKALKKRGITCATSQDREARKGLDRKDGKTK